MISILSETYIIRLLRPFYRNPITELRKTPKVYFYDLGMRNYTINNFNNLEDRNDTGALVENFVLLSLLNFDEIKINYWRTIAKAEVDFVIETADGIVPLEVKYKNFKEPKITRSLRSFIKEYKPKKAIVATKDFWGEKKIDSTIVKFIPVVYF